MSDGVVEEDGAVGGSKKKYRKTIFFSTFES